MSAELSPYADMADTLDHLDLIVREHRRARRMSLREAGESSGVDHSAIRRIEMGHSATLKTVAALLRWMDGGA